MWRFTGAGPLEVLPDWVILSTMARRTLQGRIFRRKHKGLESGPYWCEYYDQHGIQRRESSKSLRVTDARRLLEQRIAEVRSGKFGGPSADKVLIADLLDDLLADYERNGKRLDWAKILDGHLRPVFGNQRAAKITTKDLNKYIQLRRAEGIANKTISMELAFMRTAFNIGANAEPPTCRPMPKIPTLKAAPPRSGFFEHEEYRALLKELPGHLKPVLTFAYSTACRKGEILGLRWDQFDAGAKTIRLNAGETKSGHGRVIPLTTELLRLMEDLRAERDERWSDCRYIFSRYGKQITDFRGAWREASKRAAEVCPSLWDSEADKPARIFHDLRRTAARNMVRGGVSEQVVMAIGGWRTRTVFARYNVTVEHDLHAGASQLEQHLANLDRQQGQNKDKSQ